MLQLSKFIQADECLEREIAAAKEANDMEKVENLLHLQIQNLIGHVETLRMQNPS